MATIARLLKQYSLEYSGLQILRDHNPPSVDVIAVHGLAAHPVETWVEKKEKWNWLEHQFVDLIPQARVWTFGYDSSWCGDYSLDTSLNNVAESLLDAIKKQELLRKPLIFIAHSFGGIVVLKAFMKADDPHNDWSKNGIAASLFKYTKAILFFGTPFRGVHDWFQSELPKLATEKLGLHVQKTLFETFRKGSETLQELRKEFIEKSSSYKSPNVGYIWEMQNSNVGKIIGDERIEKVQIMLVDKDSAVLDGSSKGMPRHVSRGLERNHFNMHDFGPEEALFDKIHIVLNDIVPPQFLEYTSYTFTSHDQACLQSLHFLQMDDRQKDVADAANDTCIWLTRHPNYLKWFNQQHGILWVTGHPGTGKSTLMKRTFETESSENKEPKAVFASFFFHARGISDQKNVSGLYRSLLHQIIQQIPHSILQITLDFQQRCEIEGEYEKKWAWHENDLRYLFESLVTEAAKTYAIRIYIDALDECDEEAADDLVESFQPIADFLSICFSCRHYPLLAPENGLEVCVEDNNSQDIKTYVGHQIDSFIHKIDFAKSIGDEIILTASGNFQWVKNVITQARIMFRKRKSLIHIRDFIASLPLDLGDLYEGLLKDITEEEGLQCLLLMQWVCFARRPLSLEELRFAMAVDAGFTYKSISDCQNSKHYVRTDEDMEIVARDLSRGLVEVVKTGSSPVLQFIHQSVNDFLLQRGLQLLDKFQEQPCAGTLICRSHFRISRTCIRYLAMDEVQKVGRDHIRYLKNYTGREIRNETTIFINKFPFLTYATSFWVSHAEMLEKDNVSQADLMLYFYPGSGVSKIWNHIACHIDRSKWPYGTTLLHIASRYNLLSILDAALNQDVKADLMNCINQTPLSCTAIGGQEVAVKLLMKRFEFDINSQDEWDQSPLSLATRIGHEKIVKLLMKRAEIDINLHLYWDQTPFSLAVEAGHEKVVKLLLERAEIDINSKDTWGQTPLMLAVKAGHEKIVKLLLERAEIDIISQQNRDETPLMLAVKAGHEKVVKLLLERVEIDINSKDTLDQTPLMLAVKAGHEKVVKLLLERVEIDINSKDTWGRTPLMLAVEKGHEEFVKLLLKRVEIDINSKDTWGRTPLMLAVKAGHEKIVKLLLERAEIDINSKDPWGQTPLMLAAENGHEKVVKLLLERAEIDINSKDTWGQTPLMLAAENGHEKVVKLLLKRVEIDINLKNTWGRTPLMLAVKAGHEKVVKLLIERKDVDMNIKDVDGWTALECAIDNRFKVIVKLLRSKQSRYPTITKPSCDSSSTNHLHPQETDIPTISNIAHQHHEPELRPINPTNPLKSKRSDLSNE